MHISISKVNFTSIGINIAKVDFGRYDSGGIAEYYGMYITPAGDSAISVTPNSKYYTLHGKYLKYSLNGKKWKNWNGSVTIEPKQKMYLKGEDDYVWNRSTNGDLITADGYYNVGGDISSLTNEIVEVKTYTFHRLFNGDSYIKDASSLILPATTLADYCYSYFFYECTSLTAAPELHATKLANWCYIYMFSGCSSLMTAPALPATTLQTECYAKMFRGCTSLTTAPELPATTLTNSCYSNMFSGCTSLTAAPELHATTLDKNCYSNMFTNCKSLTTAPALPATMLTYSCYDSMFYGCSSLITAPELPATTLANYCYASMFYGCSSLITAPELPATTLTSYCYKYMFNGCTSLTTAPELPATTLAVSCYDNMFRGCTSLTAAPELPATTLARHCYSNMFNGCTSLTTAHELPATTLVNDCYSYMFKECTSLTTAPELPATTLAPSCYSNMFSKCKALNTAPELHAAKLSSDCYNSMFLWSDNINNITMLATDISASGCLYKWVDGVASTGTFTKAASMTTLPTGVNGIPEGWTVKDYGGSGGDYSQEYMTLSALGDGEITITIPAAINSSYATSLSYSKDKSTWNETLIDDTAQTISIPVTSGENVYLKGIANNLGNSSTGVNINSTANINASGNIMSLLYGDDYKDKVAFKPLYSNIFRNLFKDNKHLISTKDLILPATTLANSCYYDMFYNCTALTTAPELPATTLAQRCYQRMFVGCSSLNNITMLATDISASNCLSNWVNGVASTGTFTKSPEMTSLPTGTSGIPEGWTVKDYGAA